MAKPLNALLEQGQSIWLDNIHRDMLDDGELAALIANDGLRGITSNPSIFEKAINTSAAYDSVIKKIKSEHPDATTEYVFQELAIADICDAAKQFAGVYEESKGHDGMVSIEVSPNLANDTEGTIKEARDLWARINMPNVMIKVPATKEGVPAIETLISEGINVNVTLLFSTDRYREVAQAYISGLKKRHAQGGAVDRVASVASFFISRVDAAIDSELDNIDNDSANTLKGKAAIANAKLAYIIFEEEFAKANFGELAAAGAQPQRLLWASTSTKNPAYSDVLYVETLIGNPTVNTLPPATLQAFLDHGKVASTLSDDLDQAQDDIATLKGLGVNLKAITDKLESDGVDAFKVSFANLLSAIETKAAALS